MAGLVKRMTGGGALIAACVLAAAGCGGGSDAATVHESSSPLGGPEAPASSQPLSPDQQQGRQDFVQDCGTCHTFAAAGTVGQIGPNLGDIPLTEADVIRAIRIGGGHHSHGGGGRSGNMPRNLVTGKAAQEVAAFVSASGPGAGKQLSPDYRGKTTTSGK